MFYKFWIAILLTGFLSMEVVGKDFDLQGHRGARGLAPENTLAAFARALTIGVSTLELDVGISRDEIVVVTHDRRLKPDITRRPDGTWLTSVGPAIRTLSAEKLNAYNVGKIKPGSRYAKRFPDQIPVDEARIPSLRSVFKLIRRSGNDKVRLNIEAKLNPTEPSLTFGPKKFANAILDVVRDMGMSNRVTIQSFDWRVLQEVQNIAPMIATSYLSVQQSWLDNIRKGIAGPSAWTAGFDIDDHAGSIPRLVKGAGGHTWSPFHREVDTKQIKEAHELGLTIIVWTVNREERMETLIDMGVDGIITDYPDRLYRVLEKRGMKLPISTPVQP